MSSKNIKTMYAQVLEFQNAIGVIDLQSINYLRVFLAVCKCQPTTSADLNKAMPDLKRSVLNRILHGLAEHPRSQKEGLNLVTVQMLLEDMRHREVRLTIKGRKLMDKIDAVEAM